MLDDLIRSIFDRQVMYKGDVRFDNNKFYINQKIVDKVINNLALDLNIRKSNNYNNNNNIYIRNLRKDLNLNNDRNLCYVEGPSYFELSYEFDKNNYPFQKPNFLHAARVLKCSTYAHDRDPLLKENYIYPTNGNFGENNILAIININNKDYKVSAHALKRFNDNYKGNFDLSTRRNKLVEFKNLVQITEPVKRKNSINQLLRHNYRPAKYRKHKNWVFVLEENIIITCYKTTSDDDLYKVAS